MSDIERPLRILHLIDEIIRHITCGYTVRGACLAVGVAPSTGYRWLKQYYHIKEDDHARHRRSGKRLSREARCASVRVAEDEPF